MPLLSELLAAETVDPVIYGIVPDVPEFDPPAGLREAGIVSDMPNGEIDETVLDVIISYGLAGVKVTIEVPAAAEVSDPRHLVSTAASISCSLSLLPPDEGAGDAAIEAYFDRVEAFARAYVAQQSYSGYLVPVTSYLEYLFIEVQSGGAAAEFKPTDEYVVGNFASRMTVEQADAMKARLRAVFYEANGGREGFEELARLFFEAIYDRVEENCREEATRLASGGQPDGDGPPPAADIA